MAAQVQRCGLTRCGKSLYSRWETGTDCNGFHKHFNAFRRAAKPFGVFVDEHWQFDNTTPFVNAGDCWHFRVPRLPVFEGSGF